MCLATCNSCSMRSRSRTSCSRRSWVSPSRPPPSRHSSAILPPRYAVDADVGGLELHPGGRETAPLPSVVDAPYREAAYYAVTVGRLILDDKADVGAGGSIVDEVPYVALAAELLGKPSMMIDEVEGHHPLHRCQVSPVLRLEEAAHQRLVLFGVRHGSFPLLVNPRLSPPDRRHT